MIWAVWISALLLNSITEGHGLSNFPENFVLAREEEDAVLTCNTTADKAVTWKFDGDDVQLGSNFKQDGQRLKVSEVDYPMLGEYSCWSEGQMLSSVYLLLEIKESDSRFHCWAKSYDCSFNCEWKSSECSAVRVGLGPECTSGSKSCQWVTRSLPLEDGGFVFNLSHSLSPYDEEKNMLEVTAEAIVDQSIVRKSKKFFLREIVRPDSPQIVKCQKMGEKLEVTVEPPPTWSSPHSFFSLEHQTEYQLKDNGKTEVTSSTLIPSNISRLRVRSRDSLVLSNWSHWTAWKNVT